MNNFFQSFYKKVQSFCKRVPCKDPMPIWANAVDNDESVFLGAANEALAPIEGGWFRLARWGDFPHGRGLQKVTREAGVKMVANFKSMIARAGRFLKGSHGLPVFIGHPDDPSFAGKPGHTDTRAHAWIEDMEVRPDGLFIKPKWGNTGKDILENAHFKYLSPRWAMRSLGGGAFEPIKLLSVGLTNQPNIPGDAIANETSPKKNMNEILKKLLNKLGFKEAEIAALANDAEGAPTEEAILEKADGILAAANEKAELEKKLAESVETMAAANAARESAEEAAANERAARIEAMLDLVTKEGRITAADRDGWQKKLGEAEDFEAVANELTDLTPKIKTTTVTGNLGKRKQSINASNEFRVLVDERIQKTGEDYTSAWSNVKKTDQGKALYEQMGKASGTADAA